MEQKTNIQELQPLFCSRASLLEAQEKLKQHNELDCQLRLRFANGCEMPLKITRDNIEAIINKHIVDVEASINSALNAIG